MEKIKMRLVQILFEGAQILDITGPVEVFSQANWILSEKGTVPDQVYDIITVSEKKGPVTMSSGLQLVADYCFDDYPQANSDQPVHTLLICGGAGVYEACRNRALIRFVRQEGKKAQRVISICTGVFILAEAGFLSEKMVTTHWSANRELSEKYPQIRLDSDKIFVNDGNIFSSAGVTAGIDLALYLVEKDCGRQVALNIAKNLVMFMKRQGGQSQFSTSLARQYATGGKLDALLDWIRVNHQKNLCVRVLAEYAGMSERNLSRTFNRKIKMTPGKYIERTRVEIAAQLLENDKLGLKQIAAESGFGSEEKMRRAFKRQLSVLPKEYRNRFGW